MKRITFCCILFLQISFGFAQMPYSNYLDITSEWRYFSVGWDGVNAHTEYTTTYFDGTAIINGIAYYKIYSKTTHHINWWNGTTTSETTVSEPDHVREDSTGKFYYLYSGNEEVYFDNQQIISAQVGDPFPYPGAACAVQSVETVYLNNVPLKKLNGLVVSSQTGSIEGIGVIGVACATGFEYSYYLNCYSKQGNEIQFGTIDCNAFPTPVRVNLATNSNVFGIDKLKVYPNPTKGLFKVSTSFPFVSRNYTISNVSGMVILEGTITVNEEIIDISSFENGIYFLSITEQNNAIVSKLIKH